MLQPLRDIIAVAPLNDPDKIGSIYLPDQAKQRTDQGIVLFRGSKCRHLRVGDHVFFSGYTGTKVALEPYGELIFMREVDVFFFDDGKPAEPLLPFSQVIALVLEALQASTDDEIVISKVHEHFSDNLATRIAKGLEF